MSFRRKLTDEDRGQIKALSGLGMGPEQIGTIIGRNRSIICRFLKDPENHGRRKRTGRPKTLSARAERRLLKAAGNGDQSSRTLKEAQNIPLTPRRIRQIISSSPNLKYRKRKCRPKLQNRHKVVRVNWVADKVSLTTKWRDIVFSDEKKFNLDGPDGNQYYWHDLRREPQYFNKRVNGGGSVMVWAGFGYYGKTEIIFLSGRQRSEHYVKTLNDHLLPFGEEIGGETWLFQQDNAPIHTSGVTNRWLRDNYVRVLDWPAISPDLNPIENLWGDLVRLVYANGRQFNSVTELRAEITRCWALIPESKLQILVNSMPKRMIEVLKRNGQSIDY